MADVTPFTPFKHGMCVRHRYLPARYGPQGEVCKVTPEGVSVRWANGAQLRMSREVANLSLEVVEDERWPAADEG